MTLSKPADTSIWRRMMLSVTLALAIAGNSYLVSAPQLKQLSTVFSIADRCLKQMASSPEPQNLVETVLEKIGARECSQQRLTQLYPTQDQTVKPYPPQLLTYVRSPEPKFYSSALKK